MGVKTEDMANPAEPAEPAKRANPARLARYMNIIIYIEVLALHLHRALKYANLPDGVWCCMRVRLRNMERYE